MLEVSSCSFGIFIDTQGCRETIWIQLKMRIADLFRSNQGIDQSLVQKNEGAQRQEEQETANKLARGKTPSGEDSISISPLARQLATIQKVVGEEELSQQQRVEELKQKVQSGSYNVSSSDVAGSLVAFAQE